ncbi:MAG: group II intron reverse transcriptase/maturase, partial [Candidatus Eisenbacteria bacterium]|nr:group II intron reverse transcriptase/maturase [Candidatus Eisenbacteria bacterium]
VNDWCRRNRHRSLKEQQESLNRKLRGHFGYYGITGNSKALGNFVWSVRRIWRKWLDRRSQRSRMWWPRFARLLERYPLIKARAVHSTLLIKASP